MVLWGHLRLEVVWGPKPETGAVVSSWNPTHKTCHVLKGVCPRPVATGKDRKYQGGLGLLGVL